MKALLIHHFRQMLFGRSGFVYLAFGWVAAVLLVFVQGRFVAANEASLNTLFIYAPWVLALMVPALAMGVAEEPHRGLTERYLTLPLPSFTKLAARMGLAKLVLGAWVLGFAPLVATVFYLGQPDVGPLVAGLVALWGLAVVLYGLNLAVAFQARSAVVAFLGGLALNILVLAPGLGLVQAWGPTLMPLPVFAALANLSPLVAFHTLAQGHILLSAVCVLLGWGGGAALAALAAQPTAGGRKKDVLAPLALLAAFTCLCGGVALWPGVQTVQSDVTADHRFTLSPESKAFLQKLPTNLTLTLYASRQNAEISPAQQQTAAVLRRLVAQVGAAGARVTVHDVDPDATLKTAYAALEAGVDEQALPGGTGSFLGLAADTTLPDGTPRHGVLGQFAPERLPFAEFDVMSLLESTVQPKQPTLLVWQNETAESLKPVLANLTQLAHVVPGEPLTGEIPSSTEAVLLVNDPLLTSSTLAALKTYLAGGGKIMLLAGDGETPEPPEAVSGTVPEDSPQPFSSLLIYYGLKVNTQAVVADEAQASLVAHAGTGAGVYPFWLRLGANALNPALPFATFVQRLVWPLGSAVVATGTAPASLNVQPVLLSAPTARSVARANLTRPDAMATAEGRGPYWLAAMVSGKFVPGAARPGTLLVFGSSRWLHPAFMKEGREEDATQNAALFYNSVQYMLGNGALGALRAKATLPRPLTRVEALLHGLARTATVQEQDLVARQAEVATLLQANPTGAQRVELLQKAFALRQELRQVRQHAVKQVRILEDALLVLNLLLMPLLLGTFVFAAKRI